MSQTGQESRHLYERVVITDMNGAEHCYYGKAQSYPGMKVKAIRVSEPQSLSVPLREFIGEVMDKNA